jgi:hypothetical protein
MEASLIRGLMSDEEWASIGPFITVAAPIVAVGHVITDWCWTASSGWSAPVPNGEICRISLANGHLFIDSSALDAPWIMEPAA